MDFSEKSFQPPAAPVEPVNRTAITAYREAIAQPSEAIAERKALTASLASAFRAVAVLLESMDRLVLRFRGTETGREFAAAWQTARVIRDHGNGSAPATPEGPAPPST